MAILGAVLGRRQAVRSNTFGYWMVAKWRRQSWWQEHRGSKCQLSSGIRLTRLYQNGSAHIFRNSSVALLPVDSISCITNQPIKQPANTTPTSKHSNSLRRVHGKSPHRQWSWSIEYLKALAVFRFPRFDENL